MASPETEATIFHRKRKLFLGGVVCVTILTSAIVSAVFISRDNNNNNVTTTAAPTPSIQSTIFPVATDDIEDEDDSSIISTAPTFMPTIAKVRNAVASNKLAESLLFPRRKAFSSFTLYVTVQKANTERDIVKVDGRHPFEGNSMMRAIERFLNVGSLTARIAFP
jgi:hypothetical protein